MLVWLYNLILLICKLSLPIFFSDISVVGRKQVPVTGPCIIIGNHPNMFMDILVIGTTCGRPLGFWAKSTLFKGLLGKLLRAAGAVPVKRKMDVATSAGVSPLQQRMDNSELEKETFRAFNEGRAMCVFPEGTSHSESHILHLKDGVAWTKFQYFDQHNGEHDIPIIPCGITYTNKHKWRSQVLVHYGEPIVFSRSRLAAFRADPKAEVKKFTGELEEIMTSLTLNSPDWETMKLLHTVRRIYMSDSEMTLAEYVEITRRFSEFYNKFKDNTEVQHLKDDIADYQSKLDGLHLKDEHVRHEFTLRASLETVLDRLFALLILLPLALPGFLLNWPILLLGHSMNFLTPYQETKATFKLFTTLLTTPVVYALAAYLISAYVFQVSFWLCLLVLPFLGAAHVRILEEEVIGWKSIVSTLRLAALIVMNTRGDELQKLKQNRASLEKRINEMVERYATPAQRTLNFEDQKEIGLIRKLVPPLVRSNSFSDKFL